MPITAKSNLNGQPFIVIVDDEEIVLKSIHSLLKIETNYHVACYTDPIQALDQISRQKVDLVISDYLMPNMDGVQFLAQVKELNPEVSRVLLTGYADKESAIKAINNVGLFHYVEKPWDNDELLLIIRNGLEKRFLIQQLREKVSELDEAHHGLKEVQKRLLKAFI